MFLSGLDNIDFAGLGRLNGGALSDDQVYDIFRRNITNGLFQSNNVGDDEIKSLIKNVMSKYKIIKASKGDIPKQVLNQVSADVTSIVTSALGTARAAANILGVNAAQSELTESDCYLVPVNYSQKSSSETPVPGQSSPAGSSPALQTVSPSAPAYQPKVIAPSDNIWDSLSKTVSNVVSGWPKAPKQLDTIYRKEPYRQTAKNKQRLIWIVGGFGVAFALTMVVVASSSND